MRCCGNCEWSISSEDEKNIKKELQYDDYDLNMPCVGDCCLSIEHCGKYVCKEHNYIEDGISNYVLYDEKYLGSGYFIITEYNGEIVKFIKLYTIGNDFPSYALRGYEVSPVCRDIEIKISRMNTLNSDIFTAIENFAKKIRDNSITNIDKNNNENNTLLILDEMESILIVLKRGLCNINNDTNYIDIDLGNYYTCGYYKEISSLFRELAWISCNKTDENTIKRILKISKC